MRLLVLALAIAAALFLNACAIGPAALEDGRQNARIGGAAYVIQQLTDSTWTLTAAGALKPLPTAAAERAALLEANEKRSGCKVTDSDYARQGMQLDAQIRCTSAVQK